MRTIALLLILACAGCNASGQARLRKEFPPHHADPLAGLTMEAEVTFTL